MGTTDTVEAHGFSGSRTLRILFAEERAPDRIRRAGGEEFEEEEEEEEAAGDLTGEQSKIILAGESWLLGTISEIITGMLLLLLLLLLLLSLSKLFFPS